MKNLFYALIAMICVTLNAQNVTISGMILCRVTGSPILNTKIEFTKIGNTIVKDTISTLPNGYYSYTYLFELENYDKKFKTINIKPIDNNTHWFHTHSIIYSHVNTHTISDIYGTPNNKQFSTISGRLIKRNTFPEEYATNSDIKVFQMSDDYSDTAETVITTNTEGFYSVDINNKIYSRFTLDIMSDTWTTNSMPGKILYAENGTFNIYLDSIDPNFIKISGKILISNKQDYPCIVINIGNKKIYSNYEGIYKTYVPAGWSGIISMDTVNHCVWDLESITLTNVQEPQNVDFNGKYKTHTISGHIYTLNGDNIDNVFIPSDFTDKSYAVSNNNGFYSIELLYLTDYFLQPIKNGYTFKPNQFFQVYIQSNINLDIIAVPDKNVIISGTINSNNRNGIDSVTLDFSDNSGKCITGINGIPGHFSIVLKAGWSGTVTPSKEGYTFDPSSVKLDEIDSSRTINFTGTCIISKIVKKPVNLNKKTDYEVQIFNAMGRLIASAKNIEGAKLLIRNAPGLYILQHNFKNRKPLINNVVIIR